MIVLVYLGLLIGACQVPDGPDKEHPLYVPDPNRLFFLNTRQLDYSLVVDDADSGCRVYLSDGLNGEDSDIRAYLLDYWIAGQAGLILEVVTPNGRGQIEDKRDLEQTLASVETEVFEVSDSPNNMVFGSDLIANAANAEALFGVVMQGKDINLSGPVSSSVVLNAEDPAYRQLRVVLNDYLKLIR